MRDKKEFYSILESLNGRKFADYEKIVGDFDFARYVLKFHAIPSEPDEVLFVVRVPQMVAGFPPHTYNSPVRRTGLEDLLTREIAAKIQELKTGKAFVTPRLEVSVAEPGQKILPRSSMVITEEFVEARIYVQLPHHNGRVRSAEALRIFFEDVPWIVNQSLVYCNLSEDAVDRFVDVMEDADQMRQLLTTQGLVGFVAEGSQLARLPDSDCPDREHPIPLHVASELQREFDVPNAGAVRGLGIASGLTLILGDTLSGRPALLRTIADGIYNHVPDDGREYAVTSPDAVYVSADPGRSVQRVDLGAFLAADDRGNVQRFSTISADAVTSQAAGVIEALEVGARALILDESDSASEFLSGNAMLANALEGLSPSVTSLAARARELVDDLGVSLVVGAWALAGDYVPVADTILLMVNGSLKDITKEVKEGEWPRLPEPTPMLGDLLEKSRWVVATSIDPGLGKEDAVITAAEIDRLSFGANTVKLDCVHQLADRHQTATIGLVLHYAKTHYMDEGRPLRELLDLVDRDLSTEGLETLVRELRGDLVRPRRYEIAAALNRLTTLRISQQG